MKGYLAFDNTLTLEEAAQELLEGASFKGNRTGTPNKQYHVHECRLANLATALERDAPNAPTINDLIAHYMKERGVSMQTALAIVLFDLRKITNANDLDYSQAWNKAHQACNTTLVVEYLSAEAYLSLEGAHEQVPEDLRVLHGFWNNARWVYRSTDNPERWYAVAKPLQR